MQTLSRRPLRRRCSAVLCLTLVASIASAAASAHTLRVAMNGTDSLTCGSSASPCRTISQGIQNAATGDTVLVGPGTYGEEEARGAPPSATCNCLVQVDKPLTLLSTDGASVTAVDSSKFGGVVIPILVISSNVEVGRPGQGFTVTGATNYIGLAVFGQFTTGVRVVGNIAANNASGFSLFGSKNVVDSNSVVSSNGYGIELSGSQQIVSNNSVQGSSGIIVETGSGHQITGNTVTGLAYGITVASGSATVLRNTLIGNQIGGILLFPGTSATIRDSNLFGNGTTSDGSSDWIPNCGIRNASGLTITAAKNYWGASSGSGPDPADAVCDIGSSHTNTVPARAAPVDVPVVTF